VHDPGDSFSGIATLVMLHVDESAMDKWLDLESHNMIAPLEKAQESKKRKTAAINMPPPKKAHVDKGKKKDKTEKEKKKKSKKEKKKKKEQEPIQTIGGKSPRDFPNLPEEDDTSESSEE